MKCEKGSVLVVEDDGNQRNIITMILTGEGFSVETAERGSQAIELLRSTSFDVILTDLRLPDMEGTEVLRQAKMLEIPCHVIIITAFGSIASAVEATKLGAFYYLEKPLEKDQLLLVLNNAMTQIKLLKDNIMLKDQLLDKFTLENIVGAHGRMAELFKIVRKVATANSSVLIYGESGTGKELFAKSIHFNSPRGDRPFYAINCAAIPETLLESELFGYEKGAFTGAVTRHAGLFEQANGSTLFLDEIGDLTLATQAKLLRALQEKEIRRLGGKETMKLDVRIISATNKQLSQEISKGRFREDLYYRLNVIAFTIPPLRERVTDIPLLIEHFLKKSNDTQKTRKSLSAEALAVLMRYPWPGNVRQLESVIERACVMCEGTVVETENLPDEVKFPDTTHPSPDTLRSIATTLIEAKLTASEYRLYLYLRNVDGGDTIAMEAMDPKTIMKALDINKQTFYTAITRLKDSGLYDYRGRIARLTQSRG